MSKFHKVSPQNPFRLNLKHKIGDDFLFELQAQNKDGTPYDFTGYTFSMQLRIASIATTVVVDIDNSYFTITESAEGLTAGVKDIVQIDAVNTLFANVATIKYVYDIEFTDADSKVFTPIYGTFELVKDISR